MYSQAHRYAQLGFLRNMEIPLLTFSFRHLSETLRSDVAIVLVTITNPLQNNLWAVESHHGRIILTQISDCIIGSLVCSIQFILYTFYLYHWFTTLWYYCWHAKTKIVAECWWIFYAGSIFNWHCTILVYLPCNGPQHSISQDRAVI